MAPTGSPNTVLITGGRGQLATDLASTFAAHGWDVRAPGHDELDITDRSAVNDLISSTRPTAVINAAAWTNPGGCEEDPLKAWSINAMAVRFLAEACASAGSHLCQISSDYVFDGAPGDSHTEWDRPLPTGIYGRSKLGGEMEVAPQHTVVRTSRLVSHHGNNVGRNVLRLATQNPDQQFRFDDHHKGCVTFTSDLAETVHTLVSERLPGIYHVTNQGTLTWFEFASALLRTAQLDPGRVAPFAPGTQIPGPVRPEHSVLDNVALRAAGLDTPPPWTESLAAFVSDHGV